MAEGPYAKFSGWFNSAFKILLLCLSSFLFFSKFHRNLSKVKLRVLGKASPSPFPVHGTQLGSPQSQLKTQHSHTACDARL